MTRAIPRAIVFDKDGTLFDLQASWGGFAGEFLAECAGQDAALFQALAEVAGYDTETGRLRADSVIVAETPETVARTLLPYLPDAPALPDFVRRLNAAAATARQAPAVPLSPYLGALKARGLILAIATNDAEAPARSHLKAEGVEHLFDRIFGYDSGHGGKPAPGQLIAVAEAFALSTEALVMVGDSLHDLMAGRMIGARTVGVLTGTARHEDLAPLADVVLPDIGGLPAWLDGL